MSIPKKLTLSNFTIGGALVEKSEWVAYEEYEKLNEELKKFREAGDAMEEAISTIDPQRFESHRTMRMTDAEYVAVTKWRIARDPEYNKA